MTPVPHRRPDRTCPSSSAFHTSHRPSLEKEEHALAHTDRVLVELEARSASPPPVEPVQVVVTAPPGVVVAVAVLVPAVPPPLASSEEGTPFMS